MTALIVLTSWIGLSVPVSLVVAHRLAMRADRRAGRSAGLTPESGSPFAQNGPLLPQ